MSANPEYSNEEITAGQRTAALSNEEWNQQTTVDARNVLHTQQSIDSFQHPQFLVQQSRKSMIMHLLIDIQRN